MRSKETAKNVDLFFRRSLSTSPVAVEYKLSKHGQSISGLIEHIIEWAIKHREVVFLKD